jgi:hypothetical protein
LLQTNASIDNWAAHFSDNVADNLSNWTMDDMWKYLRSQLGLAAAMIVADKLPKSSPKGREHTSAPQDEYSQTLLAAVDNLNCPREDSENSTTYAHRKAAADRLSNQWKDHVTL